jgi:hypothetical protein
METKRIKKTPELVIHSVGRIFRKRAPERHIVSPHLSVRVAPTGDLVFEASDNNEIFLTKTDGVGLLRLFKKLSMVTAEERKAINKRSARKHSEKRRYTDEELAALGKYRMPSGQIGIIRTRGRGRPKQVLSA